MHQDSSEEIKRLVAKPPILSGIQFEINLKTPDGDDVITEDGKPLVSLATRDISQTCIQPHSQISKLLNQFLHHRTDKQWIVMPGLRGVGKTTILKQIYHDQSLQNVAKFYCSLDQLKIISQSARMIDLITALEDLLRSPLENYKQPLILLIDEAQYISDWALGLKVIFDRCPRVFLLATGSSALALQANPDIARRSDKIKIYPLSFTDFAYLKDSYANNQHRKPSPEISATLHSKLFQADNAHQLFETLKKLQPAVDDYWQNLDQESLIDDYRQYGSLPYNLGITDNSRKMRRVYSNLESIIQKDILSDSRSDAKTIAMMPHLLLHLAYAEKKSLTKITQSLEINLKTAKSMIDQLEQAEVIQSIRPWGAKSGHLTKPFRYLFNSPALRLASIDTMGHIDIKDGRRDQVRGLLWEDICGLYLRRLFDQNWQMIIEYDTHLGGTDFVVSDGSRKNPVIIEIGSRKTSARQITQTNKLVAGRYGVIISNTELALDQKNNTIYLPFHFFLLA